MKNVIAILLFTTTVAFSQHVRDYAGFLPPDKIAAIERSMDGKPVFVITVAVKPKDIASYANEIARVSATKEQPQVFCIIVSREPRAWRIAQYPAGSAPERLVQKAGDVLVTQLKRGDFEAAFIGAAGVLAPSTFPWLMLSLAAIGFVIAGWIIVTLVARRRKSYLAEQEMRRKDAVNKEQASHHRAHPNASMPQSPPPADASMRTSPQPTSTINLNVTQTNEAHDIYGRYSLSDRQFIASRYAGSPYWQPSCYNDPLAFYNLLLMEEVLDEHRPQPIMQETIIYNTPAQEPIREEARREREPDYTPTSSPSYDSPPTDYASSSDSSGSGGSWSDSSPSSSGSDSSSSSYDSGSSSNDSSSSSDSSGNSSGDGGSW